MLEFTLFLNREQIKKSEEIRKWDQYISYNADSLIREHKGSCHAVLLFPQNDT